MTKRDSVGALPIPDKNEITGYDPKKGEEIRKDQSTDSRGGPLTDPGPLHPTQTVEDSAAYRRADGTRHKKED